MAPEWHRVARHGVHIAFHLGADDDPGSVENVDATIEMPDGERCGATLLTVQEVERLLARWKRSGESADGLYLHVPDLILMSRPGVEHMAAAIFDLVAEGGHSRLTPLGPDLDVDGISRPVRM